MSISSDGVEGGYGALRNRVPDKEPNGIIGTSATLVDVRKRQELASVIVVESRSFVRGCILTNLSQATSLKGIGLSSVDECLASKDKLQAAVIVICAMGADDRKAIDQVLKLKKGGCLAPIVVMSDANKADCIVAIMEAGANGFMPADISLEVAAHALRLILAGGQYFPINSLLAVRQAINETQRVETCSKSMFTKRQIAVIDALRKGKANKIIAYELNMCESTVKVHVRNIMKKLNAKNRTEVAYLANELLLEQRA
jgi:DNA-binding NarL/FixJ family response regulator